MADKQQAGIAALKELYDKVSGTGHVEFLDFVATIVGGALGILIPMGIKLIMMSFGVN